MWSPRTDLVAASADEIIEITAVNDEVRTGFRYDLLLIGIFVIKVITMSNPSLVPDVLAWIKGLDLVYTLWGTSVFFGLLLTRPVKTFRDHDLIWGLFLFVVRWVGYSWGVLFTICMLGLGIMWGGVIIGMPIIAVWEWVTGQETSVLAGRLIMAIGLSVSTLLVLGTFAKITKPKNWPND